MKLFGTARVNRLGHLEIGGCDTTDLAAQFGTPLYIMDEAKLRENCRAYRSSLEKHCSNGLAIYASKAFLCTAMARLIDQEGLGLDVVSGGEIYTALQAGFPMDRVFFHGNNKSAEEISLAVESGVGRLVADSRYDLALIDQVAARCRQKVRVLLRVTPGIEAHTHEYIRTGQIDSKFGEGLPNGRAKEVLSRLSDYPNLEFMGLHCHIGSQIFETDPFGDAARLLMQFARQLKQDYDLDLKELNLGGGLGVRYLPEDDPPNINDTVGGLAMAVKAAAVQCEMPEPRLILEPGRSIAGEAGTTLYTIGSIKEIPGLRTYLAVDGGMGDNPRPALYGARYQAVVANKFSHPRAITVTVAGKNCESGDLLIKDLELPESEPGDLLAVFTTGAYNYSMSSNYNRLPRPATVFVQDGAADLVIARETYADLVRNDLIPDRLKSVRPSFSEAVSSKWLTI